MCASSRPSVDHNNVVRGGLDLIQQMGGDQHGPATCREVAQEGAQPADAFRVEAIRWLVQDQIIGIAEHRCSQREALLHPHGVLPDRLPGDFPQADLAEQLVDPAIACAGRRREHTKVVAAATAGVEARIEHASRPSVGDAAGRRRRGRQTSPYRWLG